MFKKTAEIFILLWLAILIFSGASCLKKKAGEEAVILSPEETKKLQSGGRASAPSSPAETAMPESQDVSGKNVFEILLMPGTSKVSFDKTDDFDETIYETINSPAEIFEYYKNGLTELGWELIFFSDEMMTFEKDGEKIDIIILDQQDDINTFQVLYWVKRDE